MLGAARQAARADAHDAARAVVLIEQPLQPFHDLRMILGEGFRADLAFLFARPVSRDDRALRTRKHLFENPHRLEHRDRARSVVGRP